MTKIPIVNFSTIEVGKIKWWFTVMDKWNLEHHQHQLLAGLGEVAFVVTDVPLSIKGVWDEDGLVRNLAKEETITDAPLVISGSSKNWLLFIEGRFTSAGSILTQRLSLQGSFTTGLKYAKGFDELERIARNLKFS